MAGGEELVGGRGRKVVKGEEVRVMVGGEVVEGVVYAGGGGKTGEWKTYFGGEIRERGGEAPERGAAEGESTFPGGEKRLFAPRTPPGDLPRGELRGEEERGEERGEVPGGLPPPPPFPPFMFLLQIHIVDSETPINWAVFWTEAVVL